MINSTWVDIRESARRDDIVLIPFGVIEEHGPHLCLGTDIYTAVVYCHHVKDLLERGGRGVMIAPPFYWGVCQSTGGFIGSFGIRRESAVNMIVDIVASLDSFGYRRIFGINAHGDIEQHIAIIEAFKEANGRLDAVASYAFTSNLFQHYGISGEEDHICPVDPQTIVVSDSLEPDIHAGDIETAVMNCCFPEYTDTSKAEELPPVATEPGNVMNWLFGGHTAQISPDGYLGNPSNYRNVRVAENIDDYAARIANAIVRKLQVIPQ